MLKSLLGEVSMDSLILDIFIILAVVVAGALVVYFLWELFSSLLNKSKKAASEQEPNLGEKEAEKQKDDVLVIDYNLDKQEELTEEPVKEEPVVEETQMTEVDEVKAEEEKAEVEAQVSEEERANAERRAYLEARRQELIRRMQAEMEEDKTEEVAVETPVEEEPVVEETKVDVDALEEERKALAAEKEKYAAMVRELEEQRKALSEQKVETVTVEVPVSVPTNGVLSLDELKARLAEAEERLKVTDKEFRQCKREYNPLHRVWTTHERDERKLRRKEALVAKQKVVLYGVNNYADIDEEKAKKLAEDLDLLDGLKLSVQHCEEVMEKNAERYPLLQKMYGVLSQRDEELRRDIAYYKEEIAKLEAEQKAETESEQN